MTSGIPPREPTIADVLAAIIPRQRDPLPDPDCCPTCFEAHRRALDLADRRALDDALHLAAQIRAANRPEGTP